MMNGRILQIFQLTGIDTYFHHQSSIAFDPSSRSPGQMEKSCCQFVKYYAPVSTYYRILNYVVWILTHLVHAILDDINALVALKLF